MDGAGTGDGRAVGIRQRHAGDRALAFELFAVHTGGLTPAAAGPLSGTVTFVVVNTIVDSRVAAGAGHPSEVPLPDVPSAAGAAETDQHERTHRSRSARIGFTMRAGATSDLPESTLALRLGSLPRLRCGRSQAGARATQ